MKDLSIILAPVSQEFPSGPEDLYFQHSGQLDKLLKKGLGIAAESFVETALPSSASSRQLAWSELQDELLDLFRQTKHLDMLYLLAISHGYLYGIRGLITGIDFTNSLTVRNWDSIHPAEPEADYDSRQFFLRKLEDSTFADSLDQVTIADSRQAGKHTFGSWLAAKKTGQAEALKLIEQAIAATIKEKPDYYDQLASQTNELLESFATLELSIKDRFVDFRLTFKLLKEKLAEIARLVAGLSDVAVAIETGAPEQGGTSSGARENPGIPDQISNREDVVKALEKIILFYTRNEPTSPVPIMLERAQRVAKMDFKEIVQEFNLTGSPSIQEVLGWKPTEPDF